MKEILAYHKETKNKHRWDADCDGTLFEIYIPKSSIPEPIPKQIVILIYKLDEINKLNSDLKSIANTNPLYAKLAFHSEKTKTARYDPTLEFKSKIVHPTFQLIY